jgi:ADP-dependent phosphofructokinase/glucokinase
VTTNTANMTSIESELHAWIVASELEVLLRLARFDAARQKQRQLAAQRFTAVCAAWTALNDTLRKSDDSSSSSKFGDSNLSSGWDSEMTAAATSIETLSHQVCVKYMQKLCILLDCI